MVNTKPEILIVDDEPVVCDVLNEYLADQGYLCTRALDGSEALAKLERQDFDVVLLDIRLPSISGMEVLSKIRSCYPDTATIMVTGINSADTMVEALRLGAWDYVIKPFDLDEVIANIRNLLETKKQSQEKTNCQTHVYPRDEKEDRQATDGLFSEMNAVARGVEAELDLIFGYSQIVTERTADVARQLEIPEGAIARWVAARETLDSKSKREISKLPKRSLLAESVKHMTRLLLCEPNLGEIHD